MRATIAGKHLQLRGQGDHGLILPDHRCAIFFIRPILSSFASLIDWSETLLPGYSRREEKNDLGEEGELLKKAVKNVKPTKKGRTAAQPAPKKAAPVTTKKAPAAAEQSAIPLTPAQELFQGQNSPKKRKKVYALEQWVEVTIENGCTITTLFPSNHNLIERGKKMWPRPDLVYRRINFPHGVPLEYDWVGLDAEQRQYGGCGIQRMTTDTWLEVIGREAPEIARPGYKSSLAPRHIGPTGSGNLPRPKERGGCDCPTCTRNQAILDRLT